MQIKVSVGVELGGAKVTLTESQNKQVVSFVTALLTGEKVTRQKRKYIPKGKWSAEEDRNILSLNEYHRGKSRSRQLTRLVLLTGRSRSAVIQRLCQLNKLNEQKNNSTHSPEGIGGFFGNRQTHIV